MQAVLWLQQILSELFIYLLQIEIFELVIVNNEKSDWCAVMHEVKKSLVSV